MTRPEQRSRSPRPLAAAPSAEAREALLIEFARLFWKPPDGLGTPPWDGWRAGAVKRFRERLVAQAEAAADLHADLEAGLPRLSKDVVARWQRFVFFEDIARMSDILFRGPIEPRHADDIDFRLHCAWRHLRASIAEPQEFTAHTADFRVSAVRVAMMLETARPPEASQLDGHYELPDARTLASLLALRCEKDDVEELLEMYRLVCQKLHGVCTWCGEAFDEGSSAGLFDGADTLVIPVTVPKVFVPHCGHAVHTLCFGSQLVPDRQCGLRGRCRRCGQPYAWTSIDVDPMVNAFCLLFGPYVDKRAMDMRAAGEVSDSAVFGIAEVCQSFSLELSGLVSASSAWILLARRHTFSDPEMVDIIWESVLRLLTPPEPEAEEGLRAREPPLPLRGTAVVCPEDRSDDGAGSVRSMESEGEAEQRKHVTEVFLAAPDPDPDPEPDPGHGSVGFVQEGVCLR